MSSSTNSNYLSGEGDRSLLEKRDMKLGSMLSNLSVGSSSSPTSSSNRSSSSKIQVLQESPSPVERNIEDTISGCNPPPLFESSPSMENSRSRASDKQINVGNDDNKSHETNIIPTVQTENEKKKEEEEEEDGPTLMEQLMQEATAARAQTKKEQEIVMKKNVKSSSFGLKKGFLNSKRKKKKKSVSLTPKPDAILKSELKRKEDEVFELDDKGNLVPSSEKEEIETIRPRHATNAAQPSSQSSSSPTNTNTNPLYMEQVQEAMDENDPTVSFLNQSKGQWATPDLMSKIAQNPKLMSGMSNPKCQAALEAMVQNPKAAMKALKGKEHEDVQDFIKEFCAVMGHHFVKLGEEQKEEGGGGGKTQSQSNGGDASKRSPLIQEQRDMGPLAQKAMEREQERQKEGKKAWDAAELEDQDRKRLDTVMQNEELTSLLMDPDMQRVIQECSSVPGSMRRYMGHEVYGPRLRKMMQAGLLQVA